MYVSRCKRQAVIFAFCGHFDHWEGKATVLPIQGLEKHFVYQVTEPIPRYLTKSNVEKYQILEVQYEGYFHQLGQVSVTLDGATLMNGGLPGKYTSY